MVNTPLSPALNALIHVVFQTRSSTTEAAPKSKRLQKMPAADRKAHPPAANAKAVPEKSHKGSAASKASKGGKGGKGGSAGAKDKSGKDKDESKPKVTKARSAYNFYLLKRIAQVFTRTENVTDVAVVTTVVAKCHQLVHNLRARRMTDKCIYGHILRTYDHDDL